MVQSKVARFLAHSVDYAQLHSKLN